MEIPNQIQLKQKDKARYKKEIHALALNTKSTSDWKKE